MSAKVLLLWTLLVLLIPVLLIVLAFLAACAGVGSWLENNEEAGVRLGQGR